MNAVRDDARNNFIFRGISKYENKNERYEVFSTRNAYFLTNFSRIVRKLDDVMSLQSSGNIVNIFKRTEILDNAFREGQIWYFFQSVMK